MSSKMWCKGCRGCKSLQKTCSAAGSVVQRRKQHFFRERQSNDK